MVKNNKEGSTCPGDDAMEVKQAMLLNALLDQESSDKGLTVSDQPIVQRAEEKK